MNISLTKCFVAALAFSTLYACKKEVPETHYHTQGTTALKQFALFLDGKGYSATYTANQQSNGKIISQTSIGGNLVFELFISDSLTPGTYPLGSDQECKLTLSDDNLLTYYSAIEGTLVITSHDLKNDHIAGTFNCKLNRANPASEKFVTNGQFNLDY